MITKQLLAQDVGKLQLSYIAGGDAKRSAVLKSNLAVPQNIKQSCHTAQQF